MRNVAHALIVSALAFFTACGGCDRIDEEPDGGTHGGTDAGSADASSPDGAGADVRSADVGDATARDGGGDDADAGDGGQADGGETDSGPDSGATSDGGADAPTVAICGDGSIEAPESCDDGNTTDGDYCSADCSQVTGSCGDGVLQNNESCDDQLTTDCAGTHDGGDGACVPVGTCSGGYMVDGTGDCVPVNTTGLPTPCSNGSGQTLFRFHYDNGSTSARIDVWDASCSYSFAPNSACNVREVYPGFGEVDRTSAGYPVLSSTEYIRVRFSVAGINFSQATLYVRARSYATGSSTEIEAWSPISGSAYGGPVDNDFVYDWYDIDWTNYISPFDDPNLTAIQLYAYQGSNSLAVRAVELCLE